MEQLTNMPIWAQMLSMGSFMFASGVLMTRIPLAPAIILSFFYLYGTFNITHNMPSFTLQHPWIIAALYIGIPVVFVLFAKWISAQSSGLPGDMQLGATIWTVIALVPIVIAWFVSFVVACVKWYQFFVTVSVAKPIWVVILICFAIGIIVGIVDEYFCFSSLGSGWLPLVGITMLTLLLCAGSICAIVYNKPGLLLVGLVVFIAAGSVLESMNPGVERWTYWKKREIYDPLYEACENGDLNGVKTWIAQNKKRSPDFEGFKGVTPIFVAVREGHSEIVKELIAAGANTNRTCLLDYDHEVNDKTLLDIARWYGHDDIVEILQSAGAKE